MRRPTSTSMAKAIHLALTGCVVTAASLFLWASPASAVYSHDVVEGTFPTGPNCTVSDIAVDESAGLVYVSCQNFPYSIKRFHLDGTPAPFTAIKPYIEGNAITGDPGGQEEKFGSGPPRIAIDNSSSPNHRRLFATSSPNADVFEPSGEFFTGIAQPVETTIENTISALDVGPDGSIYVGSENPGGRISKYDSGFHEIKKLYNNNNEYLHDQPCYVRIDTTGAAWYQACGSFSTNAGLYKYEADQFTNELGIPAFGAPPSQVDPFVAKPSPFEVTNPVLSGEIGAYDIDLNTNDVYVNRSSRIEVWSQGSADDPIHHDAPAFGTGGRGLAYANDTNKIYTSQGETVKVYGPGDIIPDVRTYEPAIADVGHTTATVRGMVEPAGGGPIVNCEVQFAPQNVEYGDAGSGSAPCSPDPASSPPGSNFTADTEVSSNLTGLTTGSQYHVRLTAENAGGQNFGIDRKLVPAYVLQVQTLPATEIDTDGAVLNGSLDPDGNSTTFHFEYGITESYGQSTPEEPAGSGSGLVDVEKELNGLPSGRVFDYRVVATNASGTTFGPNRTFRVGSPPDIFGARAAEVAETSAALRATIDPVGFATSYSFEYGPTPDYGQSAPAEPIEVGAGDEGVSVEQKLTGLRSGTTYHFRVVATNKWGTSFSPDTTFDFAPPSCPNDHVRQQTGSSYLPDCRAYELVSPGAAGAIILYPSNVVAAKGEGEADCCENNKYNAGLNYILNRGFATSPSRFSFYGGVGTITGINSPTSLEDMYMATRTTTGWVTTLPGLTGNQTGTTGRKECSESMSLCIDHQESQESGFKYETAPYLYTAEGNYRGRLPTNVEVVPNGNTFRGFQRMSGDFSHFVFGSAEYEEGFFEPVKFPGVPFAPGAVTTGVGSAYDNDIAQRTVTIISRLPGGGDIPTDVGKTPKVGIEFPGVSPDGSHILMTTPAGGPSKHLYMSVDDTLFYEISKDKNGTPVTVEPLGMVRDGSEVIFATKAQMTDEDNDTSTDIYKWEPSTEKTTLITRGPTLPEPASPEESKKHPIGSTDACTPTWEPAGCGAIPISPARAHPNNNAARGVPTAEDDLFAESNGAVLFYSPELLDPNKPGIPNQRNLYMYRDGAIHLVATLEPSAPVTRLQISPDGKHVGMVTKSPLTSYNNKGFAEMYTYDPASDEINCASCDPDGLPPTADVMASEGGRFMADDGRVFFATKDQLVPRDQNGKIIDVYEFVGGRPQLITSGLGSRDFTGGSELLNLFFKPENTGLEAVSHDGADVYFSTFETLVGSDHNGQFVKFYDARTGGGFPEDPKLGPCAAADECHGADSSPPAPPVIASGESVGGGNVPVKKTKKHRKKHHKKARRHHTRHNHG